MQAVHRGKTSPSSAAQLPVDAALNAHSLTLLIFWYAGAWKSPFRPLVQAGIRPAGADGAAGKPALPVLYTDSTGCASCREDIFAKAKDVFSCKMTRFKANKTAARAGGPPLLPFRAGRVNDKKVNEDNSDSGTGRRARLCRRADSLPCIQDTPLGYKIPLFTCNCK